MNSDRLTRRIAVFAGGAALVGMGMFTAGCSSSTKEAPTTSTPATSSSPAVSTNEKAVTQPVVPSIENRGGMDATPCGPGKAKVNGVCQ
ncbi:MAG: hypothetical protein KIH64_002175 [Mycobacterium sp.]|nr:hypothetical protein [Mycobacterium sp.]